MGREQPGKSLMSLFRAAAQREKRRIMKTWLEDYFDRSYMWNGTIIMTLMSIITGVWHGYVLKKVTW